MLKVGMIGWRGMVGSVLMDRMLVEQDLRKITPYFFSTSQAGKLIPDFLLEFCTDQHRVLLDANHIETLKSMDVILTCQGGSYTESIHPVLRQCGWNGYWLDAASTLRLAESATIVLDPVNRPIIDTALAHGKRDFTSGNCTVSLMLMAIMGLLRRGQIEWISSMTYQAASGAGVQHMRELLMQMGALHQSVERDLVQADASIIDIDAKIRQILWQHKLPVEHFGHPLAANLLPWIDTALPNGQTREEWKAETEANKILGRDNQSEETKRLPIDGLCVRVGALRAHSQALTIKMKKPISIEEAETYIKDSHAWLDFVPNHKEETLCRLTPVAVSGTQTIAIGRLRHMSMGQDYLTCFTVGDQLLWGAAEPLRRMLGIIANF